MSFDLMVFDVDAAPLDREEFYIWYNEQMDSDTSDDPDITTPLLRAWFKEIIRIFPPLNGPLCPKVSPVEDEVLANYEIGQHIIYVNFRWSVAEAALDTVYNLAAKHKVGFFYVSSDTSEVFFPKDDELILVHSTGSD